MKKLTVKILPWKSKYFPVQAVFTMNNVRYQLVFTCESEAKSYFRNRFDPAEVKFC